MKGFSSTDNLKSKLCDLGWAMKIYPVSSGLSWFSTPGSMYDTSQQIWTCYGLNLRLMIDTNGWAVKLLISENLSILTYKIYKYIINM